MDRANLLILMQPVQRLIGYAESAEVILATGRVEQEWVRGLLKISEEARDALDEINDSNDEKSR